MGLMVSEFWEIIGVLCWLKVRNKIRVGVFWGNLPRVTLTTWSHLSWPLAPWPQFFAWVFGRQWLYLPAPISSLWDKGFEDKKVSAAWRRVPANLRMLLVKRKFLWKWRLLYHTISQVQRGINEEWAQGSQLQNDLPGGQRKFTFTLQSQSPLSTGRGEGLIFWDHKWLPPSWKEEILPDICEPSC
jgi:hypothetical protein